MKRFFRIFMVLVILSTLSLTATAIEPGEWTPPAQVTSVETNRYGLALIELANLDLGADCSNRFVLDFISGMSDTQRSGGRSALQSLATASLLSGKLVTCKIKNCGSSSTTVYGCKLLQ